MVDILTGCAGLHTEVDPSELPFDPTKVYLSECSNVDITDAGKIKRRGGSSQLVASSLGDVHSMHPFSSGTVFVEGDALSIIDTHSTVSRLMNVTPNIRMSFDIDHEGRIFFTNSHENGFILNGIAYPWTAPDDRVGPDTTKEFSSAPVGHILAIMGGYMMIGVDNVLIISEPFDFFRYVLDEGNILLDSRIRMIRPVDKGLWIGTNTKITFYAGTAPSEFKPIDITSAPVVEGTDVLVDADKVGIEASDSGILVTTEESILFLTADGQKIDMTESKITFPKGATGTAVFKDGRYTTIINTYE